MSFAKTLLIVALLSADGITALLSADGITADGAPDLSKLRSRADFDALIALSGDAALKETA